LDVLSDRLREYLGQGESVPGLVFLFLGSMLEYIFPPFPGDTVVVFGAFLAAWAGWSPWMVFTASLSGALLGSWVDTLAGRMLAQFILGKREFKSQIFKRIFNFTKNPSFNQKIEKVLYYLHKNSTIVILFNRFFPGIRALFFVGAGMAGVSVWRVLLFGGISAILWNSVIFIAGFQVGKNWDALYGLLKTYNRIAYGVIAIVILIGFFIWIFRKRIFLKPEP